MCFPIVLEMGLSKILTNLYFSEKFHSGPIIRIPQGSVSPLNAQATLHFYNAFWALYLPITVAGRVSDIWRSYFAQALFGHLGLRVGFLPRPLVVQDRNPHSYTADFEAELALYLQSSALVKLIGDRLSQPNEYRSVPQAVEDLWIDLYQRGYIELKDVYNVQLWLQALCDIGYVFPDFKNQNQRKEVTKGPAESDNSTLKTKFQNSGIRLVDLANQEYESEKNYQCNVRNVTFGNADLHDGCRADIAATLSQTNQKIVLLGSKGKLKNYPHINEMPGVQIYTKLSNVLNTYRDHSTALQKSWIVWNYQFYRDDLVINSINTFVCSFPASMCQLWFGFEDASIAFLPAHRYNLGRCTVQAWTQLNKQLKILNKYSVNTIGALSRYDQEYLRYYTGLSPKLVPSYSGSYLNKKYDQPVRSEYLIVTVKRQYGVKEFIQGIKTVLEPEGMSAEYFLGLYKYWTLEEITQHPAIIMLPYAVMSYKLTEFYAMGIPLFMPSPKFFRHYIDPENGQSGLGHDRTSTTSPYCKQDPGLELKMRPSIDHGYSTHPYSPNVEFNQDIEAEMYWLQYADYYEWPHIQLFDNYEHLRDLLKSADLKEINRNMMEEVKIKKLRVTKAWCDIAERARSKK
jgi:hypothetical protein